MGAFTIYSDNQNNSTLISNQFIDLYMKDANEAQIKTYLYLVRMMSAGRSTSISSMADVFNHTEKEIVRSLRYWEKKGLIRLKTDENGELCAVQLCQIGATDDASSHSAANGSETLPDRMTDNSSDIEEDNTPQDPVGVPSITLRRPVGAKRAVNKPGQVPVKRSELFFIVEQYIGKPLSVIEMQKINYIADDLHFSDDLIDFLVQYCVGNGKKDFRYIEKVALNWSAEGISTTSQARENVVRGPQRKETVRTASGVQNRNTAAKKPRKAPNSFNQFSQNDYDFEELEKQLLNH